jgi:hypothetical protein
MVYYCGIPVIHIATAQIKGAYLPPVIDYQVEFKPIKPAGNLHPSPLTLPHVL